MLPPQNLLAHESSPYLRQHKDNPVHWRPWSRAALDEAQALQKPVLLSVGYAACHWCHVMAHESFEDDDVAAVMNRLFVNIKVDREERPDIDQIYMAALTAMGEQGGWPLTMFLTPDARPFWGGTYFPKLPRYGRPGIVQVLEAVARTWQEKRDELARSSETLAAHVRSRLSPDATGRTGIDAQTLPGFAASIFSQIDQQYGGLRGAPKFPNAPFMEVLALNWLNNGEAAHRDAVVNSLRIMLSGGIYDHIGGGLCRYSTDGRWLVPHFEKMLYDNAQLIDLACFAYSVTGDELFRCRIEETIRWLEREMFVPGRGFAASLDADSDGEEGLFYLWTKDEMIAALGSQDTEKLLAAYSLERPEDWEGDPILHRLTTPDYGPADNDPVLTDIKARLLAHREKRIRPGRDDKVLVDWNGRAIAAIVRASRLFDRSEWLELARSAFRFVAESAVDDRLPHSILGEHRLFPCMASDYAAMIEAAVTLCEATGERHYVEQASRWLTKLDRWHGDETETGHYLTAEDADDVPMRIRGDIDEATPSATAQVLRAMLRLAILTSDDDLYERAVTCTEAALARISSQRYGQAGIVLAAELVRQPKKLVIADDGNGGFVSAANRFADMARTDVLLMRAGQSAEVTLPGGAVLDTSSPGAWLCIGQTCLPPARSPAELERLLRNE